MLTLVFKGPLRWSEVALFRICRRVEFSRVGDSLHILDRIRQKGKTAGREIVARRKTESHELHLNGEATNKIFDVLSPPVLT